MLSSFDKPSPSPPLRRPYAAATNRRWHFLEMLGVFAVQCATSVSRLSRGQSRHWVGSGSPTTLTTDEQRLILRATAGNVRDHTIISLALGTGLRLAEIVCLDVGDVFAPDGTPRVRVRVRAAIAKGGRAADVFLPDRLVAKLKRFWRWKRDRGEDRGGRGLIGCTGSTRCDTPRSRTSTGRRGTCSWRRGLRGTSAR